MKRLTLSLAATFLFSAGFSLTPLLTGLTGSTQVFAAESEPEAIIRGIYEGFGPDSYPDNPCDRYFSPSLLKLWDEVEAGAGDSIEYAVDFDIFLDAQDTDKVTDISTVLKADGPDKGSVDVTFTSFGEPRTMRYSMVKLADGWKIDDLSWGTDRPDLRSMLEQLKKDQAAR